MFWDKSKKTHKAGLLNLMVEIYKTIKHLNLENRFCYVAKKGVLYSSHIKGLRNIPSANAQHYGIKFSYDLEGAFCRIHLVMA